MFGLFELGALEKAFLLDLVLSFVCGILIGGERELRGKPAGVSTQTLVITAAMLFSFISHTISGSDPTRIAAQIVSGIGFLGAGLILRMKSEDKVSNVTTAASVWYSAAVGMALGFDFHFVAIAASLYAVLIASLPHILHNE